MPYEHIQTQNSEVRTNFFFNSFSLCDAELLILVTPSNSIEVIESGS